MRLCEIVESEFIRSMEPLGGAVERICAASEPVPCRFSISTPKLVLAPKRRATRKEPEKNSPVDEALVCKLPRGTVWLRMLDKPRSDGAPCTPLPIFDPVALPQITKPASGTNIENCDAAL